MQEEDERIYQVELGDSNKSSPQNEPMTLSLWPQIKTTNILLIMYHLKNIYPK